MGKTLIIKGADFSANAISSTVWHTTDGVSVVDGTVNTGNRGLTTQNLLDSVQNKDINIIRLPKTGAAGTMRISVISSNSAGSVEEVDYVEIAVPLITETTVISLPKTLHVASGQGVTITATNIITYIKTSGSQMYTVYNGELSAASAFATTTLGIDFGYSAE